MLRIYAVINHLITLPHLINVWLVFPSLILLVLSDIVLRSFFNAPISWAHEVLGLLLLCLFFLEMPRCLQLREFLSVDILYNKIGRLGRAVLYRLSCVLILLFSIGVAWQGAAGALDSWEYGDRAYTIAIPYWPFYILVSLTGVLMVLLSFFHLMAPQDISVSRENMRSSVTSFEDERPE